MKSNFVFLRVVSFNSIFLLISFKICLWRKFSFEHFAKFHEVLCHTKRTSTKMAPFCPVLLWWSYLSYSVWCLHPQQSTNRSPQKVLVASLGFWLITARFITMGHHQKNRYRAELMFCQWENRNGPNGIMQRKCRQHESMWRGLFLFGGENLRSACICVFFLNGLSLWI